MLRLPTAAVILPLILTAASAASYRIEYTLDVTFGASALGVNIGDQIHGWIDFDDSALDANLDPTMGSYVNSFVDYGFTSHSFVTPSIDWSLIVTSNDDANGSDYLNGYIFSLQTIGGAGLHLEKFDLSVLHASDVPLGYMLNDAIPTSGAFLVFPSEYGSVLRFDDSGVEIPVDGTITAMTIRPTSVPDGASTLVLLGLSTLGTIAGQFMRRRNARAA